MFVLIRIAAPEKIISFSNLIQPWRSWCSLLPICVNWWGGVCWDFESVTKFITKVWQVGCINYTQKMSLIRVGAFLFDDSLAPRAAERARESPSRFVWFDNKKGVKPLPFFPYQQSSRSRIVGENKNDAKKPKVSAATKWQHMNIVYVSKRNEKKARIWEYWLQLTEGRAVRTNSPLFVLLSVWNRT